MGISISSTVNSANTKYHISLSSGGGPDWSIIPSSGKSSKSKAEFTAAAEYGAKYGIEIDATKRDDCFKRDYLTGTPNFNDKLNFMATNMMSSGRLMDQNAVPPKDFSFFYKQGTDVGTKNSLLIIGGKGWSEKVDVPFKMPAGGKNIERYFYLSDLYKVYKEKEESYEEYNKFLNKLIVTRIWGDIPIEVGNRQ